MSDGDLEKLDQFLSQFFQAQNQRGIPDFEGYSPNAMDFILYDTFGPKSPIQLQALGEADMQKIPLLNQVKYLMGIIESEGELKLTARGFLPVRVVADIHAQQFIPQEPIEAEIIKVKKEKDSRTINLTRILLEISNLTKKRKNKLSLTKKGREALKDSNKLLEHIFLTFVNKFNWAYYDLYVDQPVGQLGMGFSLILLNKYGSKKRKDIFYAEKYFKAFPALISYFVPRPLSTAEVQAHRCYVLRTFTRFLKYFGLVELYPIDKLGFNNFVKKAPLFDKYIKIIPPPTPDYS